MSYTLKHVTAAFAGTAFAVWLALHFGLLTWQADLQTVLFSGILVGGLLCIISWYVDSHGDWLHKGHRRERATEIIVPPRRLGAVVRFLHEENPPQPDLQHFINRLSTRTYRQLVSLAYGAAGSLFVLSVALGAWKIRTLYLAGNDQIDTAALSLSLQQHLVTGLVGVVLSASGFYSAYAISRQCTHNLYKVAEIFMKQWEFKSAFNVPTRFLSPYMLTAGLLGLMILPFAALESYHLKNQLIQQGQISNLVETRSSLKELAAQTQTRLDSVVQENLTLNKSLTAQQDANKKLTQDLKKTADLLSKAKKDLITEGQKTTDLTAQLKATKDELGKQTERLKSAWADTATLKDKLSKADAATASLTQQLTDLQNKLSTSEKSLAETKIKLASAEKAVADSQAALQKTTQSTQLHFTAMPDGLHMEDNHLVVPEDVLFTPKTAQLRPEADALLRQIAKDLLTQLKGRSVAVAVSAHTDVLPPDGGEFSNNTQLTGAQAHAVARKLVEFGLTWEQLRPMGLGDHFQLDNRIAAEALTQNRRLEIYLLDDTTP